MKNFVSLLMPVFALLSLPARATVTADETIVPGRYIVVYRSGIVPGDADVRSSAAGARIVHREDRLGIATVQTSTAASSQARPRDVMSENDDVMSQLAAQPGVEYVLHDRVVSGNRLRTRTSPTSDDVFSVAIGSSTFDTFYNSPQGWAVRQAGGYGKNIPGGPATGPWDTSTGKGIRVAVLDTGVDATHPDIAPNLVLNLSEIDKSDLPSMCDDGSPQDQAGHGTWTASLAAGALGQGTGRIIGVAPSASILNIKVLERIPATITGATDTARCLSGESAGLLSWVLAGINDAIANNAQVITMSLGATVDLATGDGAGVKSTFDRVTYAALQAGAVLVAAAGNDGYNLANPRYVEIPAQARGVLAVIASTNPDCAEDTRSTAVCTAGPVSIAYYSNYGDPLNAVAAPGGSYPKGDDNTVTGWVRGACSMGLPYTQDGLPNDAAHSFGCFNSGHTAYVQAIGTSAASPLVAGAAAVLMAAHPTWDAQTVIDAIRNTATPPTVILPAPLINLPAALLYR